MQQLEIRVEGHLDECWVDWLDGFSVTHTGGGETILTGRAQDQAALYGLIAKLRDLGVNLISVNYKEQPTEGTQNEIGNAG